MLEIVYQQQSDGWFGWCVELPTGVAYAGSRKTLAAAQKDARRTVQEWKQGTL